MSCESAHQERAVYNMLLLFHFQPRTSASDGIRRLRAAS